MFSCERHYVAGFGAESQGYAQLQQKTDVEIAEIVLQGIQKQYILDAPLEESILFRTILYYPVQSLAHEHGHGILVNAVPYAKKRISCGKVAGCIET